MKHQADPTAAGETSLDVTDDSFLGGKLRLLQPRHGYRAGIDAVLLAAAVPAMFSPRKSIAEIRLLDVGAGVGTVGLCAARRVEGLKVDLFEREPTLADLAKENIARNALADQARVHLGDVMARGNDALACKLQAGSFAVVAANPPFSAARQGTLSSEPLKRNSHSLGPGETLDQWCRFLARMCCPGGLALMIHTTEGLPDVIAGLKERFGGIVLQPLHPRAGEEANRIIVAARKGLHSRTRLLPGIPVHSNGNEFTPRISAVLRDGAALDLPI